MDNLINNTLPGLPLATSSPGANSLTLADTWQNELMASAFMVPENALGLGLSVNAESALDTAAILSLQSIMADQPNPITEVPVQPYLDAEQAIAVNAPIHSGIYQQQVKLTEVSIVPYQQQITPAEASIVPCQHHATLTEVSIVPSGQPEPVDARLLGWGNVGQGILSYISAANGISFVQPPIDAYGNVAQGSVKATGLVSTSAANGLNVAAETHLAHKVSYAAARSTTAGNTVNNGNKLQQQTSANTHWGYDITPQALFFVLTEQQGFRATVRDYFTKDATLKRLNELRQDGSFNFGNVQEIWLNGKPLHTWQGSGD